MYWFGVLIGVKVIGLLSRLICMSGLFFSTWRLEKLASFFVRKGMLFRRYRFTERNMGCFYNIYPLLKSLCIILKERGKWLKLWMINYKVICLFICHRWGLYLCFYVCISAVLKMKGLKVCVRELQNFKNEICVTKIHIYYIRFVMFFLRILS